MFVEEFSDGKTDRLLLSHLISNKEFLSSVLTTFDTNQNLFQSPECNLIASLSIRYFRKYKIPAGKTIEQVFIQWAESHPNQSSLAERVSQLLTQLGGKYEVEECVLDHLIDLAGEVFNRTRLAKLKDRLEACLDSGDVAEAQKLVDSYNKINLGKSNWCNAFTSESEIRSAFANTTTESLLNYTGDLGSFFANIFERDCFVAFQGGEKSGKTFVLLDVVFRALQARRRVCFFGCGDMTLRQYKQRLYSRMAFHPYRTQTGEWPYQIRVPVEIEIQPRRKDGSFPLPDIKYRCLEFDGPITEEIAIKKVNQFQSRRIRSLDDYFKMACYSNFSVSALDIENEISELIRQEWIPDVVVIDYADIMAPIDSRKEHRHQVNETWMTLRRISSEFHILLVTATQADAETYDKRTQTRRNFSDDKRKHSHVTAMIGNNQTQVEKKVGVRRFNILDKRDGNSNEFDCVVAAGCLDVCSPCILSKYENAEGDSK